VFRIQFEMKRPFLRIEFCVLQRHMLVTRIDQPRDLLAVPVHDQSDGSAIRCSRPSVPVPGTDEGMSFLSEDRYPENETTENNQETIPSGAHRCSLSVCMIQGRYINPDVGSIWSVGQWVV